MHCWAAVSHYVDYKGDWDVPGNLKMALSALGGLFYVADSEFEQFNVARIESKKSAEQHSGSRGETSEINLDTVTALLEKLYPDRAKVLPAKMSELVRELKAAGYTSMDKVREDLISGENDVKDWEKEQHNGEIYFKDIGAARHALEAVSPSFKAVRESETRKARRRVRFGPARKPS